MAARSRAWVSLNIYRQSLTRSVALKLRCTLPVDLGGSLAVASRGLFSTGVSTDLSGAYLGLSAPVYGTIALMGFLVTYLNAGGKIGDTIRAVRIVLPDFGFVKLIGIGGDV